jgi:hypothetical protein
VIGCTLEEVAASVGCIVMFRIAVEAEEPSEAVSFAEAVCIPHYKGPY